MSNDTSDNLITDKKKALLAHKEKLLQEIKYYEQRIASANASSSNIFFTSNYSSDSEDDLPTIINGPSIMELKTQQKMLRTCLQATQELTSVQVLQSQVDVMVDDPVLDKEAPIKEPGLWREVIAECRIDLVPFSISFYVHKPNRKFGPLSYHSLKVLPVKNAHEVELSKSVLPRVTTPSEAIEAIRNYAVENRSRRTTLAKLVDKFTGNLFMEPLTEGGYSLKCADLLEMSWRLENKLSPVASFHHRMKFDLEYMDESYIKTITQAHKQLSDPTITTDDRTELLAIIINTCIEAKGPTQELYESMESEPETVETLKKRRTTLDQEEIAPIPKKKKDNTDKQNDEEIMAPPKSIPKKTKAKNKDNMSDNRKSVKRSNVDEDDNNVKKAKTDDGPSMLDRVEAISKQIVKTNTDKNKLVSNNEPKNATTNSEKNKPAPNKKKAQNKNDGDKVATENNKSKQVLHSKDEGKDLENTENAKVAKTVKNKLNNNKIVKSTKDLNQVKSNDGKGQILNEVAQKASKKNPQESTNENGIISKNTKAKQVDAVKNTEKEPVKVTGKDKKVASTKNVTKAKDLVPENTSKDKDDKKNGDNNNSKKDNTKNTAITKDQTAPTQKLAEKESNFKASTKNSANIKKSEKAIDKPQNATKNNAGKGQTPETTDKEIKASSKDDVILHKTVSVNKAQNTDSKNKASTKNVIVKKPIKDKIASVKNSQNSNDPNKIYNNKKIIASKTNDVIIDNNKKITNNKLNINIQNNDKKTASEKEIKSIEKIIKKYSNTAKAQINTDNKNAKIPNTKSVSKEINTKTKTSKDILDNSNKIEAQNKKPTKEINAEKSQKRNTAQKISEITQKESTVNTKKSLSKNTVIKNKENNPVQEIEKSADRTYTKTDEVRQKNTQVKEKHKISLKNIFQHNNSRKSMSKKSSGNIVAGHLKSGNSVKSGIVKKTSKIPLINSSPISLKNLLRLPLRMSPRNIHSKLKSASDTNLKSRNLKPETNIPRWTKKADINHK